VCTWGRRLGDATDHETVLVTFSLLSHLECSRTGERYDADQVQGVSKAGAPLLARYDLERARSTLTREDVAGRPKDLWRYHEVLPVRDPLHITTLGEGMTPLLPLPAYGAAVGVPELLMKDEGSIPTGTFKARGAAVGVSRARELGVQAIAMPTNGNAGAAWAAYAARAGMGSLIVMPVDAPEITRRECVATGAELYLVDGLINHAGALVKQAVEERSGYQEVSTLKEPYRIEGKKTMGYEIAEQLGWEVPDVILYPAGGGVGLIGIHKAMLEMQQLGLIGSKLPRLVAVQSTGCPPIVDAFEAGLDESELKEGTHTLAFGINVPKALGDFLVLRAVRESGGTAIAVDDDSILREVSSLARQEGAWICPEGAACMVAVRELRESGWIRETERVVVLNTGTGLKYPETVPVEVPVLARDGRVPPA
jgi:threonine synthase